MPPGHSPLGGILTSQQRFSCTADPGWHADSLTNLQWILYSHALPTSQVRSCWTFSPILGWHFLHRRRQGPSGPILGPHVARCSNIGRGGNPNLQTGANVLDLKANSGNSKCRRFFFIKHNEQNERLTNISLGYKVWKHFQQKNNETSDIQPTNIIYMRIFLINQNGGIKPAIIVGSQWENHGIDMIQLTLTFGLEKLIEMG